MDKQTTFRLITEPRKRNFDQADNRQFKRKVESIGVGCRNREYRESLAALASTHVFAVVSACRGGHIGGPMPMTVDRRA